MALNPDIADGRRDRDQGRELGAPSSRRSTSARTSSRRIKAGTIAFAVDQQQYLQGYLPIVFLKLYKTNANTVGGGQPVLTGPGFVDKSNAHGREARGRRHAMTKPTTAPAPARRRRRRSADERLANISLTARILRRPEIGALLAAIVVAIFFWTQNALFLQLDGIANWTDVASTIGIPAVMVALLMIGGEFDLSAGVMTGSAGLMMGILATEVGMNIWLGDRAHAGRRRPAIGFLNGYMVMRTKLPSFIVTLATFFILQGAQPRRDQGDHRPGVGRRHRHSPRATSSANKIFGGTFWAPHDFKVTVLWWIAITAARRTWVLTRTRDGNWIFGVGGDANAARNVGVPVARVKIGAVHGDVVRVRADRDHDRAAAGVARRPARASARSSSTSSPRSSAAAC